MTGSPRGDSQQGVGERQSPDRMAHPEADLRTEQPITCRPRTVPAGHERKFARGLLRINSRGRMHVKLLERSDASLRSRSQDLHDRAW